MRDLQQGSMLDHMGKAMGPVSEKSTHIYLPEKQFLHIFTQMIISPQSQWAGKVPTDRDLCTCASYCLKDIGVFLIVGNVGIMRIYIYLSILKIIGTYELK